MNQTATLTLPAIDAAVRVALQRWHNAQADDPLAHLTLHRNLQRQGATAPRQATQRLIIDGLEQLAAANSDGAKILRLHYIEKLKVNAIANKLDMHAGTVNKKQREAIAQLADMLYVQEVAASATAREEAFSRLEQPTYLQLFGVDEHVAHLLAQVMQPGPPWLFAIEGMGGIGKTSLADSLMRRAIVAAPWCTVAWATARQRVLNLGGYIDPLPTPALSADALVDLLCSQLLPDAAARSQLAASEKYQLLRAELKRTPHLVVVDNLETVQDVDVLLAHLRDFAEPSKFLLTSRHNLYHAHDIHHFSVPQLGRTPALALIRFAAKIHNLPDIAAADDDELAPIFASVGGNPLALRLVVGQLHVHTLSAILQDLASVNSRKLKTSTRSSTGAPGRIWTSQGDDCC